MRKRRKPRASLRLMSRSAGGPGQSGVEAVCEEGWKASWQLPVQAAGAGLLVAAREGFDPSFYAVMGRRNRSLRFHPGSAALYRLVRESGGVGACEGGYPVWGHELHLLRGGGEGPAVGEAAVRAAVAEAVGAEWVEGVRLVERFLGTPHASESRAFEVRYASRTRALTREAADRLRQRAEERVCEVLGAGARLRPGKNGHRVRDLTRVQLRHGEA
jgi:hypothetical protein